MVKTQVKLVITNPKVSLEKICKIRDNAIFSIWNDYEIEDTYISNYKEIYLTLPLTKEKYRDIAKTILSNIDEPCISSIIEKEDSPKTQEIEDEDCLLCDSDPFTEAELALERLGEYEEPLEHEILFCSNYILHCGLVLDNRKDQHLGANEVISLCGGTNIECVYDDGEVQKINFDTTEFLINKAHSGLGPVRIYKDNTDFFYKYFFIAREVKEQVREIDLSGDDKSLDPRFW